MNSNQNPENPNPESAPGTTDQRPNTRVSSIADGQPYGKSGATTALVLWLFVIAVLAWSVWSATNNGVVASVFNSQLDAAGKLEALKRFFAKLGVWAPLVYVLFVMIEVIVAPLPGAMLYAPGGIIFGSFWGGLLSLIGNVLGAGIACQLMRSSLGRFASQFLEAKSLTTHEAAISKRGLLVIVLLRLNPLTSSDLISYAAGLTSIPVWKVMTGTAIGMAPLCFAQAWLADELLNSFPNLLIPLIIVCVVYAVVCVWILNRLWLSDP